MRLSSASSAAAAHTRSRTPVAGNSDYRRVKAMKPERSGPTSKDLTESLRRRRHQGQERRSLCLSYFLWMHNFCTDSTSGQSKQLSSRQLTLLLFFKNLVFFFICIIDCRNIFYVEKQHFRFNYTFTCVLLFVFNKIFIVVESAKKKVLMMISNSLNNIYKYIPFAYSP